MGANPREQSDYRDKVLAEMAEQTSLLRCLCHYLNGIGGQVIEMRRLLEQKQEEPTRTDRRIGNIYTQNRRTKDDRQSVCENVGGG